MLDNLTYIHRYLLGQVRRIYFMALPESKQDFKSSRIAYTTADTAAQTIGQLTGGTFLATLMTHSGISDSNIGIITSLVSFAALSQLFLMNYFKKLKKYKFLVCITSLQRVLFSLIYLIPLLAISSTFKSILIVLLYFTGQVFVQIGIPTSQDWIASLVPSRLRGKYFSIKDSVAVFVVSTIMLFSGMLLDYYKGRDLQIGFNIIATLIFLLTTMNVIALSKMKEPKQSYLDDNGKEMHGRLAKKAKEVELNSKSKEIGILSEIKGAFLDRKFRKAFTIQCLFIIGFYICIPFYASYQINDLSLPYTFIMLVGFIFNLYRIYITPRMGRLADRYGMPKLLRFSFLALGFNFLILASTVPGNAYIMHIINAFSGSTAWSFLGIGLFGIQLDFFKNDKRMVWLTITSSVTGAFGFIVSIIGGNILSILQRMDIRLFGIKIYAQQILCLIGFCIIMFAFFFIKYRIETEKIDTNRQDGRISL